MFRTIWVAGMPRSGSMWTYNVVRELARRAGRRVLPEKILLSDQECYNYANRVITANRDPKAFFVLKIHARIDSIPPGNFVITNLRDVRDAVVSFMRFMHVDFDEALGNGRKFTTLADHYLDLPDEQRMVLNYHDITTAPASVVASIADRIGISIDDAAAEAIAAQFSKAKVRTLTESRDQMYRESVQNQRSLAGQILLKRGDDAITTIDPSTGFQSDHVSDYQDGAWRQLLSADQIEALDQVFGKWLTRNGFTA